MRYICSAFRKISRLGYGVMVTLQILVLSFMVRDRVAQQSTERLQSVPFFLCHFRNICRVASNLNIIEYRVNQYRYEKRESDRTNY